MKVEISHAKNALLGWDITITATSDGKPITQIDTVVNDFPEAQDILDPPANSYDRTYVQKGIFPGDNEVVATATDEDGKTFTAIHKWNS